jgi:hypothetical protein
MILVALDALFDFVVAMLPILTLVMIALAVGRAPR